MPTTRFNASADECPRRAAEIVRGRLARPVFVQSVKCLAGVLAVVALAACGDRAVNLYSGLSESEANRLVAYLDSQGVGTRKVAERDGLSVTVASSQLARASQLSTQAGLPRTEYKGFGAVFPKDGLISSPLEERARLTYATSQELEAMLADIDGVLGARVNVVIPERRNGRNTELPAAAVLIRHRADMETDLLEMKVRRLVAASVPGLVDSDSRQISVTFMPVYTSRPGAAASVAQSPELSPTRADAQMSGLPVIAAGYALSPSEAALMPIVGGRSSANEPRRAVTLFGIVFGALGALIVIAWALKDQLTAMFRNKDEPAAGMLEGVNIMKPALQIHPSWMNPQAPSVSETWRWFNLERWMPSAPYGAADLRPQLTLDATAPSGYPAMLCKAAWIVAEAIWRDGVSRGHLDAADMRWARRLGLALMGDGPVSGVEPIKAGRSDEERNLHASLAISRVRDAFPSGDQALLRLAMEAPDFNGAGAPGSDQVASQADGAQSEPSREGRGPGAFSLESSNKLVLLVRLSKRHAAASFGVDLRLAMVSDPLVPSAEASVRPPETHADGNARIEPTMFEEAIAYESRAHHVS